jgi:hypothetical protein
MRYVTALAAVGLILAVTVTAQATVVGDPAWPWLLIPTDTIAGGAVSYDKSGGNVVSAGHAFYTKITSDNILPNSGAAGNLAMYGVFHYTNNTGYYNTITGPAPLYTTNDVLAYLAANANTPMPYEFKAYDLKLDFNGDSVSDLTETFILNAQGIGQDYLWATYTDLMLTPGYSALVPGAIWIDAALLSGDRIALSVVINGFSNPNWNSSFDAALLSGALGGANADTHGSGLRVMPIPEPLTMAGLMLGLGGLVRYVRNRRTA